MLDGFRDYDQVKAQLVTNKFPKGLVAFGSARIPMNDPHLVEIE